EIANNGKAPTADANNQQTRQLLLQEKREFIDKLPNDTPVNFAEIIRHCWKAKPAERPTAQQVFNFLGTAINTVITGNTKRSLEDIAHVLSAHNLHTSKEWQNRFGENLPYIMPYFSNDLDSEDTILATDAINSFLEGDKKLLLILGESGCGKSLLLADVVT